jgi:hypothetical protein
LTDITIRISPRSIPSPFGFIAHFLPYWVHPSELFLIFISVLFVPMGKAVDSGECAVKF